MLENFGRLYLLIGPMIVLVVGTVITIHLTSQLHRKKRWWCLCLGPAITLLVAFFSTYLVITLINPSEGSGFILGSITMVVYALALLFYYPIIIIRWIITVVKKPQAANIQPQPNLPGPEV